MVAIARLTPLSSLRSSLPASKSALSLSACSQKAQYLVLALLAMCDAHLAIVDRRSPEVRNTRVIPVGERLLARNRRFTCGSVAGRKVYGETGSAGCLRATAALRADPSSDGKFTVKQVRRVACDQPPPPSPNGTTPTHTTEYSSTKSVLLNPNRRHPNPPNNYFFRHWGRHVCSQ